MHAEGLRDTHEIGAGEVDADVAVTDFALFELDQSQRLVDEQLVFVLDLTELCALPTLQVHDRRDP